jgi:hypothetical protein
MYCDLSVFQPPVVWPRQILFNAAHSRTGHIGAGPSYDPQRCLDIGDSQKHICRHSIVADPWADRSGNRPVGRNTGGISVVVSAVCFWMLTDLFELGVYLAVPTQ